MLSGLFVHFSTFTLSLKFFFLEWVWFFGDGLVCFGFGGLEFGLVVWVLGCGDGAHSL